MFQFIGYSFFGDENALNSAPSNVDNITSTQLTNAIFDHFNVTKNTDTPFSTNKPDQWDYDTIMNADFDNSIEAGNVDFLVDQVSSIKIKRRVRGTFDWLTLGSVPINTVEDLEFVFTDRLNAYGVEYEYAFVPVLEDVEGEYIINSVFSEFDGVFIGDADSIFRLMFEVGYGTVQRNQQVGTFTPLGKKYPVVVANGLLSYETGSVNATLLNEDFEETGIIDKTAIVSYRKNITDFLTNKHAKILKDLTIFSNILGLLYSDVKNNKCA